MKLSLQRVSRSLVPAVLLACALPSALQAQHLVSWGRDNYGQVSNVPGGTGFTKISTSYSFTVAQRPDGSLVAWGEDFRDQVSGLPQGTGYLDFAAGYYHGVSIQADGTLVAWGDNGNPPQPPAGNQFVDVEAGFDYSMALRSDGTLVVWGADTWSMVSAAPTGSNFAAIACGNGHAMAMTTQGTIHSWGRNAEGQVTDTPAGQGHLQIAAGALSSMALRADGSIAVWGGDHWPLITDAPTGTGFTDVSVSDRTMIALRGDGSLVAWGEDTYGEVSQVPGGTGYLSVDLGVNHGVAIRGGNLTTPPIHNISRTPVETYSELQAAVDGASDGDVLLVSEGLYDTFTISGKSLSIFAVGQGATIPLSSTPVTISNLGPQQRVVLSGLNVMHTTGTLGWGVSALRVQQNLGYVYVQDSHFESYPLPIFDFVCTSPIGVPGTMVQDSNRVVFSSCEFTGRGGSHSDDFCSDKGAWSTNGTAAAHVENSTVVFTECNLVGGNGGGSSATGGGQGGAGLRLVTAEAFLLGSLVRGGIGGFDDGSNPIAPGGPGALVTLQSELHHLDSTLLGGGGSTQGASTTGPGLSIGYPGVARSLDCEAVMSRLTPGDGTFFGQQGDTVYFLRDLAPKFRWLIPLGVQQVSVTLPLLPPVGTVPAGGFLVTPLDFSALSLPPVPTPVGVQGFSLSTVGTRHLSGVRHTLPLDPGSLPDCNLNGINDYLDILLGTSLDADSNLRPDECGN